MDAEIQKAQAFIERLLQNPALAALTPLQQEEQIAQFLKVNASQLKPTLNSAIFPGKSWSEIMNILYSTLVDRTNKLILPTVGEMINSGIDYSFAPLLSERNINPGELKKQLAGFVGSIVVKPAARKTFTGAFTALQNGFAGRYVDAFFARRSYVYFELTKVQRLKMGKEEIKNLVKLSLLLRPSIHLLLVENSQNSQDMIAGVVSNSFIHQVYNAVVPKLDQLPPEAIKSSLNTNISFQENPKIEATARIAAILSARCKTYKSIKVDRGAETPDKSWVNIARRNYKFYGFDIKMLDEFYQISAENGW